MESKVLKDVQAIKEAKTAVDEAQGEEEDTSDTTMATSVTFHSCKPQFFGPLPKEALKTAGRAAALAKVAISMWPGLLKFGRIAFTLLPALGDRYYRYTHVLAYIHTVVQTSIHAFLCVCARRRHRTKFCYDEETLAQETARGEALHC